LQFIHCILLLILHLFKCKVAINTLQNGRKKIMGIHKYRTDQEVDWQAVMKVQRWLLLLRKDQYRSLCRIKRVPKKALETAGKSLRSDLQIYQNLRRFLGYAKSTTVEKEIEEILTNLPESREEKQEN